MPRAKKMTPDHARLLTNLVRAADNYFRHPDVDYKLGYQTATRMSINLEEVATYLEDHVVDPEGEGLTAKDRRTIAKVLREAADHLSHPEVAKIAFALSSRAMAARLREAASRITR